MQFKQLFQASLNPDVDPAALRLFKKHVKAGTTPGNPKWYRAAIVRARKFIAGAKPVYPRLETGAQWFHEHHSKHEQDVFAQLAGCDDVREYVRAFEEAKHFIRTQLVLVSAGRAPKVFSA